MKAYLVVAYYHYTQIEDPAAFTAAHLGYCKNLGIRGRIYVAAEGINGTLSGTREQCLQYMADLEADPRFKGVSFKADEVDDHVFNRLHVREKKEIVHSGLRDPREIDPTKETGKKISGNDFLKIKDNDDVVILDVRSNYETRVGKFRNSVTLDMETFREFPGKIQELEQYRDKKVVTVCTGGIKCEKASAWLLRQGFKDVSQLHNGIIGYANETGGKDFDGVLYVFDGRVTVPVNTVNPTIVSTCSHCGEPAARNLNCANVHCNVQFVMCESCAEKMQGACSEECRSSPGLRAYNGTGYYTKPVLSR